MAKKIKKKAWSGLSTSKTKKQVKKTMRSVTGKAPHLFRDTEEHFKEEALAHNISESIRKRGGKGITKKTKKKKKAVKNIKRKK